MRAWCRFSLPARRVHVGRPGFFWFLSNMRRLRLNIVPIYSVVTLCDDVRDLNANPCRAGRFLQGRRQNACLLVSYRTLALTLLGFGFV